MSGKRIVVKQIRSSAGRNAGIRATLEALGLGKIGKHRSFEDRSQVRGMLSKVGHLVCVMEKD